MSTRCIFTSEYEYGAVVREYYVDQVGPYVVESRYEMLFHGWGDHIGEPGSLIETRQYPISFAELREAAQRAKATAFLNIDETNWEAVLKTVKPTKRKRMRGIPGAYRI